jgi:hypothetical protein
MPCALRANPYLASLPLCLAHRFFIASKSISMFSSKILKDCAARAGKEAGRVVGRVNRARYVIIGLGAILESAARRPNTWKGVAFSVRTFLLCNAG